MSGRLEMDDEKGGQRNPEVIDDGVRDGDSEQDLAIGIVGEHAHAFDPVVEARVLKKIDWYLIPAMSIGYGLVYYDKVSQYPYLTYASTDFQRLSLDLPCSSA